MTAVPQPIPFSRPSIDDDDIEAVTSVLRSGWLTTGEQAMRFEQELADYLGGGVQVRAVASCTHALEICFAHLDLPPGSRVGVPTWTFVSTALSGVHLGLQPVLLDVDEDSLNLSPNSLAAAIDGLDVVVPVHFAGSAVADQVFDICAENGVPVIEDAAHALGTRHHDGSLVNGDRSLAACYSFYATKNLASGEGGAIATIDDDLAEFALSQRLHGMSKDAWKRYTPDGAPLYDLVGPGIKANFPDLLAGLARSQLRRFDVMQARRRALIERYRTGLESVRDLRFVPPAADAHSADHLCVVVLPESIDRAHVVRTLADRGIATSVHFRPLHQFGWMQQNAEIGRGGVTTAESLSDRVMSLPLYPDLGEADVDRIVDLLIETLSTDGR